MKTTITTLSKILAATALLASAGLAQAASLGVDIAVSATISAKCTISTTAVAFGEYDPVTGSNKTAAGSVVVACTKGATGLSVGLGNGSSIVPGVRTMVGASASDLLAYSLVQPITNAVDAACPAFGAGTAWTTAVGTTLNLETSPGKTARTYKVCGQIAAGQDQSVGSYTDTVVATINF